MLPSSSKNSSTEEHHPMDDDHHDIQPLQEPDDEKPPSSLKKTMSLFRSNSLTERRYRTKSIKRSNPSSVQDETSSIQSGGRFIEEELLASPMVTSKFLYLIKCVYIQTLVYRHTQDEHASKESFQL
jgi:hypothetical protein